MPSPEELQRQRLIDGARRYAAFDRSDPFTMARVMSHIKNGICANRVQLFREDRHAGDPGGYDAKATPVKRTTAGRFSDGSNEYLTTGYGSISRP